MRASKASWFFRRTKSRKGWTPAMFEVRRRIMDTAISRTLQRVYRPERLRTFAFHDSPLARWLRL